VKHETKFRKHGVESPRCTGVFDIPITEGVQSLKSPCLFNSRNTGGMN
jgi:hypothetical protein